VERAQERRRQKTGGRRPRKERKEWAVESRFRRRVRELVAEKFGSTDRFYLETDFSKGHLSLILRGRMSPSLATIAKLARALDVDVVDLFRPSRAGRQEKT
jgi:transcriptional regulator with XRE-family HTH domain